MSGPAAPPADITETNRAVARMLAGVFGGTPSVARHRDEALLGHVDILTCRDAPRAGLTAYATVTLANHPLYQEGAEFPGRCEILGVCASAKAGFATVLAACAFQVINARWFLAPGIVFPGILENLGVSDTLEHILFVPPFLWENRLQTMETPDRALAFLLAVPISNAEYAFAQESGGDALEDLFAERGADPFDLDRPSVL
ncbi:suppressor of fused domain protein [Methylobacterium sp. J-068]|uniref:suppressor of fused domain protein n=1 Tax=Methylobacterium sp. J-068 TaxID=2836649 RepID=UPI001FB904BE|nr:suppressor of fused domain protein [Methylobacterium sp. J-068]MCJ2033034.1 suppressor of fused domain protein [Methylobacterium sp. J-068]